MPFVTDPQPFDLAAHARIALTYWWRHGRVPNVRDPRLFTELVQWRKLHDRDPRLPLLADKVAVKAVVAERLGRNWVVPDIVARRSVARCGSGSHAVRGQIASRLQPALVRAGRVGRLGMVRGRAHRWLERPYGGWLDEWLYAQVPRGILIEPFIGRGGVLPVDYKLYVFGGRVAFVQVHLDANTAIAGSCATGIGDPSPAVPSFPRRRAPCRR